ncbi:hypothetical protein OIU76_021330 [Salix suchowensis]|nr:hypothetical protein OIU76_021330 [Salix suchowensis]
MVENSGAQCHKAEWILTFLRQHQLFIWCTVTGLCPPHQLLHSMGSPSTVGRVPKILQHITNQASGDSESLTPQKKLLNSIDTVEKVVMEELQKLKRTPSAKKAETEKRVRTLMSMR